MKIQKAGNYREQIIALLSAEKLPVDDLPETLDNFIVAMHDNKVTGVIGLEVYDDYGLLRSMAVLSAHRKNGIANQLVKELETIAQAKSIKEIYLLTETAHVYFTRKGYQTIARLDVPEAIKQSSEFSHTCPQSAIVMKKTLNQL